MVWGKSWPTYTITRERTGPGFWAPLQHTDSEDLRTESKDSAADRTPKARRRRVRARLSLGSKLFHRGERWLYPNNIYYCRKRQSAYGSVIEH